MIYPRKHFYGMLLIAALALFSMASASWAQTVVMPLTQIVDGGNKADLTGFGSVSGTYGIGTFDVTCSQYTTFLNAVAQSDQFGCYDPRMATAGNFSGQATGAGISRSGAQGNYSYNVIGTSGSDPVTYVTWLNAARFCNWMENSQPASGLENAASTEEGTYKLDGDVSAGGEQNYGYDANHNYNPVTWWIPNEDEWYKAAYYDPTHTGTNGASVTGTSNYWAYPMQSSAIYWTGTTIVTGTVTTTGTLAFPLPPPGNDATDPTVANQANYWYISGTSPMYTSTSSIYSVTQSGSYSATQNYLTPVGTFVNSPSHYGTYDQGGDVYQWVDPGSGGGIFFTNNQTARILRGGSWGSSGGMASNSRDILQATIATSGVGFRVATSLTGTSGSAGTTIVFSQLQGTKGAISTSPQIPVPAITSSLVAPGMVALAFSYQIKATNGAASFSATGLPDGLSVDPTTGIISGTPTVGGTFGATISAINTGGTGSAILALIIPEDLKGLKGSYAGLASLDGTNAGLFTLSLTAGGGFAGKLALAGAQYHLAGVFSPYGTFTGTTRTHGATLTETLTVDPSVPGVRGTISVTTSAGTSSYTVTSSLLRTFNAQTLPRGVAGRYTASIPAVSGSNPALPSTSGSCMMTVTTSGAVSVAGKLLDGTAFSARGQLHADKKTITLFNALYAGQNPGSVAGSIVLETAPTTDADGVLDWIKPAQSGRVSSGGFSARLSLVSSKVPAPSR